MFIDNKDLTLQDFILETQKQTKKDIESVEVNKNGDLVKVTFFETPIFLTNADSGTVIKVGGRK